MLYSVMRMLLVLVARVVIWRHGGFRVVGTGRVPRRGAVVIAPNHISHVDPLLVAATTRRPTWFVATDEMFNGRLLSWMFRNLRCIPIRQDTPDRRALRQVEAALRSGMPVVMFPEGHESRDGQLQPLQGGPVMMAIRCGAPMQPVWIEGTSEMMPPCQFGMRMAQRPATIRYGELISVEALTGGLSGRGATDHGLAILDAAIRDLGGIPRKVGEDGGHPTPND